MFTLNRQIHHLVWRGTLLLACAVGVGSLPGCSDDDDAGEEENSLSFFVTSTTHDGDVGGLAGADGICQTLAGNASAAGKTWRAYLSAANGGTPIHARSRIGAGPWHNASGAMIAADLTELHGLIGDPDVFVTETGDKVNGQWNGSNGQNGAPANEHDIMTGSDSQGMLLLEAELTTTCDDWTSNALTPGPQVGHTDGMGPMMDTSQPRFTSWNGGHAARGCSAADLSMTGSTGRFYCFASD